MINTNSKLLLQTTMPALFILAAGWILVGAADVMQSEVYYCYENSNTVVSAGVISQSPADSHTRCASFCQQQDACEAFTFDGRVCSGHRVAWTPSTTQSASGARLFVKKSPCSNYTVLDDVARDVNNGGGVLSDNDLTPGWYRFLLDGTDAVMPTQCVNMSHCGTLVPVWLNLNGRDLPGVGQEISAVTCVNTDDDDTCCLEEMRNTSVRNCGAFYVYKIRVVLQLVPFFAYCAQTMN